ncbi:hypothetical protein Q2T42_25745 [Leptolyngbya boryana CZ1]|uniref:Uncharacterized protein n=1 Tax=Leptolyngbya boryana CZ1 TaxID=3060204 RepID=A0AA96WVW2_LEPBY|nr:hypothetical protein [Leptolyngbya boryana]WNZ45194.1 hypothetical protein Q2T42_25745 [Leptolyngbya boryana CZ1]
MKDIRAIIQRAIAAYEAKHGEIVPSPEVCQFVEELFQTNSTRTDSRSQNTLEMNRSNQSERSSTDSSAEDLAQ